MGDSGHATTSGPVSHGVVKIVRHSGSKFQTRKKCQHEGMQLQSAGVIFSRSELFFCIPVLIVSFKPWELL
jgi:hypothetical protein